MNKLGKDTQKIMEDSIIDKELQKRIDILDIKAKTNTPMRESYFDLKRKTYTEETIKNYVNTQVITNIFQHRMNSIIWARLEGDLTIIKQFRKHKIYVFLEKELIHITNFVEISKIVGEEIKHLSSISMAYNDRILLDYSIVYGDFILSNYKNFLREKKLRRVFNTNTL